MKVTITDIQRFCMHDGPGIRTVVFFKGCPLHCLWCHNPETQAFCSDLLYTDHLCVRCGECEKACAFGVHHVERELHTISRVNCKKCGKCALNCPAGAIEISGREADTAEIIDIAARDIPFYHRSGGITLSGGEPMAQPAAAKELLELARARGITTAIETSGAFPVSYANIAASCDTVLFDIKDTDPAALKANTGAELDKILHNLDLIDRSTAGTIRLRCIMIPEINMNEAQFAALAKLQQHTAHCEGIELLPYHTLGMSKIARLGRSAPQFTEPTEEMLRSAADIIRHYGGTVIDRRRTSQ